MLNKVIASVAKKMHRRATIAELNRLSDRELADIGISRSQIKSIIK